MANPRIHVPIGSDVELQEAIDSGGGGTGGSQSLTSLSDVTGEPGPGKAPVADHTGTEFPLTEVATQAYVDEQVNDALARWAVLNQRLNFVESIALPWRIIPGGIIKPGR